MIELLKQLGTPTFLLVIFLVLCFIFKEIWSAIKITRIKASQDVLQKMLEELDNQINEFYLPLRQRLDMTYRLYNVTIKWTIDNKRFDNSKINLVSEDNRALSKIVNHGMFFPLNSEAENILLTKTHLKHSEDKTDYEAMLLHFILWRAFENVVMTGEIESYDGSEFLQFPSNEALNQKKACEYIIIKRDEIRNRILNLQSAFSKFNNLLLRGNKK